MYIAKNEGDNIRLSCLSELQSRDVEKLTCLITDTQYRFKNKITKQYILTFSV